MSTKELTGDLKAKVNEQKIKLCRAVAEHPCVYDRSEQHKKDVYEKTWEDIARQCDDTVLSCKVRWRNIRSAFIRSMQSTSRKRPNRNRDYYLHEVLQFYIPHMNSNAAGANKNSDSEIDDELETSKPKQVDKFKSPNKKTVALVDEEATTSAEETVEEEQDSPTTAKSKVNTFFIKEKPSKVGTFIIKKSTDESTVKRVKSEELTEDKMADEATPSKVDTSSDLKFEFNDDDEDDTPLKETLQEDARPFRFRRACKRSLDKKVVQQLRNSSPKKEVETKRSRRSLLLNRSSTKANEVIEKKLEVKTATKVTPAQRRQQRQQQDQQLTPEKTEEQIIPSDVVETQMKTSPLADQPFTIQGRSFGANPPSGESEDKIKEYVYNEETPPPLAVLAPKLGLEQPKEYTAYQEQRAIEPLTSLSTPKLVINKYVKQMFEERKLSQLSPTTNVPKLALTPLQQPRTEPPLTSNAIKLSIEKPKEYFYREQQIEPAESAPTHADQAIQCVPEEQVWDDAFLNTLRPQMSVMNARQKLHFKQKVYRSLIEVFDNSTDFPGPNMVLCPTTGEMLPATNDLNTREMSLIQELAAMVQAAKISPELMHEPSELETSASGLSPTSSASAAMYNGSPSPSFNYHYPMQQQSSNADKTNLSHRVIRKVVKISGNGSTVSAQGEGDKRRFYRILPKSSSPATVQPPSNVRTFIIPRAPGSIASSANAAAINNNSGTSSSTLYRQLPVSGGTVVVSSAPTMTGDTPPGMRRMMTVRSTFRPSASAVPRQIVRRYSVCGASNGSAVGAPFKVVTTTANIPTLGRPRNSTHTRNVSPIQHRIVRATTSMPPFKLPAATTTVTQAAATRATPIITSNTTKAPRQLISPSSGVIRSYPPVPVAIGTGHGQTMPGFSSLWTHSSAALSSADATSTVTSPLKVNEKSDETERLPTKGKAKKSLTQEELQEGSDGIIASDNFGAFNIKSELMD